MTRKLARFLCIAALGATAVAAFARPGLAAVSDEMEVDLELVLAVDVSGSIDSGEAELQRKGLSDAFLSREVMQAITSGPLGRIGIAVVFFSSAAYGVMDVPIGWTVISDQASAAGFARAILDAPRFSGRGTAISDALELSKQVLDSSPLRSTRRVIDVSGDGVNNAGRPIREAREEVVSAGITINGLPIADDSSPQDLADYFQGCVIGGPGAFVLPATGFADFARAIRRKLILEISDLTPPEDAPVPRVIPAAASGTPQGAPARPMSPNASPYTGECDFPMFGGYGRFGGPGFR